ncbi:thiamine phosphate synthase [Nocardioides panacisoli]|uniref:thiamine phosphate synthase n=1 Tax=Nocardioides panacisoli TaxID=627624 RepID=UPI001C629BD7|nr:thiamine phosphate synthase [Nocardioides panacisoli]QYJ02643.1 thiamine phosphate synthase [Nocardioides panacisoli]
MIARLFCLVSDHDDLTLLPALADAGVDGFQVRAKGLAARPHLTLVEQVMAAVGDRAQVVVNDRVDIALAAGAHGVHLGDDDLPVAAVRRAAPSLVIGATCRDRASVGSAAVDGADYAGFGPVFATDSKAGLPDPLGTDAVATAAGLLPLVAIGGITAGNARRARDAGAHGVAVIGGIWRPPDPVTAAKELVTEVA